jgi:cysteine desulfurase
MSPWLQPGVTANASSVHAGGREAREAVEAAREDIAAAIGASHSREVILSSGATEANNTVLRGAAQAGHIVTTAGEHPSVLEVAGLARPHTEVPLERGGWVSPQAIAEAIEPQTRLCSVIWVNNETGVINDLPAIAKICRERGVLLHTDASQALGKVPVDLQSLGCDFATFSSHKIYGPLGAGALWVRPGTRLVAHISGGHQERGRRAGTENTAAIVGFGAACRRVSQLLEAQTNMGVLREQLWNGLAKTGKATRNGEASLCVAGTLNVSFTGFDGETGLMALDLAGISVSTGSACTAGSLEPSHVLLAMGLSLEQAGAALRFSLGVDTSAQQIERTLSEMTRILGQAREEAWSSP